MKGILSKKIFWLIYFSSKALFPLGTVRLLVCQGVGLELKLGTREGVFHGGRK